LWDRRRDRYFVEDHGVVSAPSATAYAFAAGRGSERRNATPRRAAVVDPEQINPSDGRPATLSSDVNAIYSGQLRQGSAATSRAVTDDVAHRDVVHIAARVITSGEYPSLSRLVMADEPEQQHSGSVFAREIAHGTVGAELVALAGQPGAAGDLAASGSLGVARALLAAGVPTVVGSVVNTTTADLDRTWLNFHRHYATGTAAAESLRRAQLAALGESKRRTGSWATLTVFGSTQ
jgi:CHAT domain-containing protein